MVDIPLKISSEELVAISMMYSMICLEVKEDEAEAVDLVLFLKIYLAEAEDLVALAVMIFYMNAMLLWKTSCMENKSSLTFKNL